MRPLILLLIGICSSGWAVAQTPLPPEVEAAFNAGAHYVIGCEGCHWEAPDKIPRSKIPAVCGDCHPGAQDDFNASVHWADGTAHAVCTDCHGIHGILPVKNEESKAHRSLVCGSCHPGPMEELDKGPHREAFDRTGAMVCASCHSNHAVLHPTVAVVEPACTACHPTDSEAYAFGSTVSNQFEMLRTVREHASKEVDAAEREGYEVAPAARTLSAGNGAFTQARLIWHSLDDERIREQTSQASSLFDRTLALIQERIDIQRKRETAIVGVWIVIAIGLAALHLKRKSLTSTDDQD